MASWNNFRVQIVIFILFSVFCFLPSCSCAQDVKLPVVAGSFYSSNKFILSGQVNSFFDKAKIPEIEGEILGLISPHAGYIYSGPIAAFGFKAIKDKKIDTVIVIGPSHYYSFRGIATGKWSFYRTPLGDVPIDKRFIEELVRSSKLISYNEGAFLKEHSVEVELPFLQKALSNFKIVPLVTGWLSLNDVNNFADALKALIGNKNILIVASSDLSHYLPYSQANVQDKFTIDTIMNLDVDDFYKKANKKTVQACGSMPIAILISLAKNLGLSSKLLKYANSGDTSGDKSRVVGYASVAFYKKKNSNYNTEGEDMLNLEQKKRLLEIARKTIKEYLTTGKIIEVKENDKKLLKEEGAFVTLHSFGQLRGCIGNIYGRGPLYKTVRDMAIASATEDPRFSPVTKEELKDIEIEISVLSIPERIFDTDKIEMGKHGVIVKRGFNSGVFLPQVATETGWNKEQFLSNLCSHKAGLKPDAWKDKHTEIYIFTAQVFSEKEIQ